MAIGDVYHDKNEGFTYPVELGGWLGPEVVNMFPFVSVPQLEMADELKIVAAVLPDLHTSIPWVRNLVTFAREIRSSKDELFRSLGDLLSTRQLVRIAKRMVRFPDDSLHGNLHRAFMSPFLPTLTRDALDTLLSKHEIMPTGSPAIRIELDKTRKLLKIGSVSCHYVEAEEADARYVPQIEFYDNQTQLFTMQEMLKVPCVQMPYTVESLTIY